VRRPGRAFGWLDARLVRDGWLARLGPDATAVMTFLALVADRHGASFYGRDKMAAAVGHDRGALDRALALLLSLGLVDQRSWSPGHPDGVWQLLPLPASAPAPRGGAAAPIADLIRQFSARGGAP
jgi:hypothetical protein